MDACAKSSMLKAIEQVKDTPDYSNCGEVNNLDPYRVYTLSTVGNNGRSPRLYSQRL